MREPNSKNRDLRAHFKIMALVEKKYKTQGELETKQEKFSLRNRF